MAAVGCTLGIVPHMAAAIAGVAALLHTSAVAFSVLKWLGVAYLLYRMLQLSAVFMAITLVVFAIYGAFAAAVRDQIVTRPRVLDWMRRVFAGSFVALSAKLALTRQ